MPITPNQYIDTLCQLVPDEPTTPGVTLAQAEQSFAYSPFSRDPDFETYGFENILTPRRQLRQILKNTATHVDEHWNGWEAIYDAGRLFEKLITPEELGTERLIASYVFALVAQAYAMSILPEIALCRPHDRPASAIPDKKFPAWHLQVYGVRKGDEETASMIQMRLARMFIPAVQQKLHVAFSSEEVQGYLGGDYLAECVAGMARPMALELNQIALQKLIDGAYSPEEDCLGRLTLGAQTRYRFENASNSLFARCHGDFTHVIVGPDAWVKLHRDGLMTTVGASNESSPERIVGLVQTLSRVGGCELKVYKAEIWWQTHPNTVLLVRNIPHDLAGALAYCPYRWGMEHLSSTPSEEGEGSISRVALTHEGALDVVEPTHAVKVEL